MPGKWRLRVALVVAGVVLDASGAWAASRLDEATQAYSQGRLEVALVRLAEAENDPALTEDDLVRLMWTRVLCHAALRQSTDMTRAMDALLAVRPLHEPSALDGAPPVLQAFKLRQQEHRRERGVELDPPTLDGAWMQVKVSRFPEQVAQVVVFVRAPGDPVFATVNAPVVSGVAGAMVPQDALWQRARGSGALECVVEARSHRGAPLVRMGTRQEPLRLALVAAAPVPPPDAAPPAPEARTPSPDVTQPVPAPVGQVPAAPQARASGVNPRMAALVFAAGGGISGVFSMGLLAAGVVAYALTWALPADVGKEASWQFRVPYYGSLVLGVGALLFGVAAPALMGVGGLLALRTAQGE